VASWAVLGVLRQVCVSECDGEAELEAVVADQLLTR
jgi:hypothetical protein